MKIYSVLQPFFRDRRQSNLFLLLLFATGMNALLVLARYFLTYAKAHPDAPYAWPEVQGVLGLAFGFLGWNLLLAWIPYLAALQFERKQRQGAHGAALLVWLLVWLLFLPNAPYMVTDFIHLQYRPPIPVWYDMVMLFSFAFTGLLLGILSLYEMRLALLRFFSSTRTELFILASIGLAGFGVWMGRFQRWNSWDIMTNPRGLLRDLFHTMTQRHELIDAIGVSGLMASILLIGYAMLRIVSAQNPQEVEEKN